MDEWSEWCENQQMGFGKVLHRITQAFEKMEVIESTKQKGE